MPYHTTRLNGSSVEIDFDIVSYGCASNGWDEAGEGPEICITRAYYEEGDDDLDITLSDEDRFRIEEEICNEASYFEAHDD